MKNKKESKPALPQHRVDVVELGVPARRHWLRCEIGENLNFDPAKLQTYCLARWDEQVYDAFVVAAAVQFCDHTKRRPSTGWGRDFVLRVPVHDPDRWSSTEVSTALHDALTFLTCDQWQITFTKRKKPVPPAPQGNFNIPDDSCVIIPFSDGLDSCAVAGLTTFECGQNLIPVQLGSKLLTRRRTGSRRIPFASIPYRVRCGNKGSVETSARSRGFKFALLCGLAAYLSQAEQVMMPESGQGALGPVLIPVGQAYEDYRNHPIFTDRMTVFLSAIFGRQIRYVYPRLWHTKAETLVEFVTKCRDGQNWAQTRSCWQGQRHVSVFGKMRQCGICTACMLRRMSVHAADLTECGQSYVWEDLTTARYEDGAATSFENKKPKGAMYEHAIAGTLHLDHLAGIQHTFANQAGLARQVDLLSKSLGLSEEEVRTKLKRLLEKHSKEWRNFIDSLGPESFVAQWVERREAHVRGGTESC